MSDELNVNLASKESLATIIGAEGFDKLSEKNQQLVISGITGKKDEGGGMMGKVFGAKKENAAMHIALAICVLLAVIGWISATDEKDYWNVIIPAITTGMGYMFGKGER